MGWDLTPLLVVGGHTLRPHDLLGLLPGLGGRGSPRSCGLARPPKHLRPRCLPSEASLLILLSPDLAHFVRNGWMQELFYLSLHLLLCQLGLLQQDRRTFQ